MKLLTEVYVVDKYEHEAYWIPNWFCRYQQKTMSFWMLKTELCLPTIVLLLSFIRGIYTPCASIYMAGEHERNKEQMRQLWKYWREKFYSSSLISLVHCVLAIISTFKPTVRCKNFSTIWTLCRQVIFSGYVDSNISLGWMRTFLRKGYLMRGLLSQIASKDTKFSYAAITNYKRPTWSRDTWKQVLNQVEI